MPRRSAAEEPELARFGEFAEFELNGVELAGCLNQVAAAAATPAAIDLGCPNVLCSRTDLVCGGTNLCITDTLCSRNPVC